MNERNRRRSGSWWLAALLVLLVASVIAAWPDGGQPVLAGPAATGQQQANASSPEAVEIAGAVSDNRVAVVEAPPPPPPTDSVTPVTAEPADFEARDWLSLLVVDVHQQPVAGAKLLLSGLRKQDDGSWYGMRGDPGAAVTDAQGEARIDYTRWVDIDGRAAAVDLQITHPDFIPFHDSTFVIGAEPRRVVLTKGGIVRLTTWCKTRTLIVRDVEITTDHRARLGDRGWQREPDGTCTTTRLSPGPHFVQVRHRSAELGATQSRIVHFVLPERQPLLDIDVELRPLLTMRGRLAAEVPRPVVGGHVALSVHASADGISLATEHEAPIAADGSFELVDVPEGSGQLIAWCKGWVSQKARRSLAEIEAELPAMIVGSARAELAAARHEADLGAPCVPDTSVQDLVVAMEPTGTLEVVVTDTQGRPLPGVEVDTSPNVYWRGVGSTIFPWGTWSAATDAEGVARITDLPPEPDLFFGARSAAYRLRQVDRDNMPTAVIVSGGVTRRELVLERIPE
ncbi:MAG: Ig-like domain-containing protein [Planctomycetes bacterium]|nr:Ig-like domain-containing protein [Planctomycetota bacterium]